MVTRKSRSKEGSDFFCTHINDLLDRGEWHLYNICDSIFASLSISHLWYTLALHDFSILGWINTYSNSNGVSAIKSVTCNKVTFWRRFRHGGREWRRNMSCSTQWNAAQVFRRSTGDEMQIRHWDITWGVFKLLAWQDQTWLIPIMKRLKGRSYHDKRIGTKVIFALRCVSSF